MAGYDIDGLINWLRRDEWRPAFEDVLDEHMSEACEVVDGSADDLASLLGSDIYMVLWRCALEDFMTRRSEGGANIVTDYLKRRGFRETASTRAFMTGLRDSAMSLYEISDVRPGESFLARDLIRGGEPVRVSERSGSHQLKLWDRIAARIVRVGPKTVMGGGALPFSHNTAHTLLDRLNEADEASDGLAGLAPLFTRIWLASSLEAVIDPGLPQLRNTDGDDILFTTVRYPLLKGARVATVRSALDLSPELVRENGSFWNWLGEAPPPSPEGPPDGGLTIASWGPDGSTVLGSIEVEGRWLEFNVNSAERAARAQALLAPLLQGLVGAPQIISQTLEDLRENASDEDIDEMVFDLPEEEQQAALKKWMDNYYHKLLDDPVPMLGNKTPRELAKQPERADELVAWLKLIENRTANAGLAGEAYDLSWMWDELGVSGLRR